MTYRVPEWEDLFLQGPEAMKDIMESSWDDCMSEDVDKAPDALIHYLACLEYYLRQINPATARAPIERLRTCLVDLLNGQQPDLLKVQRGRGRAPTAPVDMEALITASALITFLMERGQSEEQAARYVTRRLKTHRKKCHGVESLPIQDWHGGKSKRDREDWERLQDWRDKLLNESKGKFAKQEHDYRVLCYLLAQKTDGWKSVADETIGHLK